MAGLSDHIAAYILFLLEQQGSDVLEIQRNELANYFSCQPSQINYVLSTRFSMQRGYIIESQRGGNGYIRIRRIPYSNQNECIRRLLLEEIKDVISQQEAYHILHYLNEKKVITEQEEKLLQGAVSNATLTLPIPLRHQVRAMVLKGVLEKLLI